MSEYEDPASHIETKLFIEKYQNKIPDERSWIITNSRKSLNFKNIRKEDIDFDDIAVGLANTCRYNGQCRAFYSVAEHSDIVSRILEHKFPGEKDLIISGFAHDFAEAYMGDMTTPLKHLCPGFKYIEEKLESVIEDVFDLKVSIRDPRIKMCDMLAWRIESRFFFGDDSTSWQDFDDEIRSTPVSIRCLDPKLAVTSFYGRAIELGVTWPYAP